MGGYELDPDVVIYEVHVTRDDEVGAWVAEIAGLAPNMPGATRVEHFADLDVEVRDLIVGLADTDPDAFDLRWHYDDHEARVREAAAAGAEQYAEALDRLGRDDAAPNLD